MTCGETVRVGAVTMAYLHEVLPTLALRGDEHAREDGEHIGELLLDAFELVALREAARM